MKQRDILALIDGITPGIDAAFQKAIAPLLKRVVDAETLALELSERLKVFEGQAATPSTEEIIADVVRQMDQLVPRVVADAVAEMPSPAPGKDGASVTTEDVAPLIVAEVTKAVAALPPAAPGKDGDPGKDGASVTTEDVAPLIEATVAKAVAALPPAAPGKDGDPGKDGASVTVEQLAPMVAEQVNMKVAALTAPKDGVGLAGAMKDHEGCLILTLTNGEHVKLGRVDGERGKDGLGYDDMEVIQEDERKFILRFSRGEHAKEFAFSLPVVLDRGVFKEGDEYVHGDGVTCGGSFWIAQAQTKARPGTNDEWRLAVKKGRDGKDVVPTMAPTKVKL